MSATLGVIGILAILIAGVMLVVNAIRKKRLRIWGITAGIGLALFIAGIVLSGPTTTTPTTPTSTTNQAPAPAKTQTMKVAVFNDCKSDILDTQIFINNDSVKHIAIYNGYWADFGSFEVTTDDTLTIRAVRYHVPSGEESIEMNETIAISDYLNIAFSVNEEGISIKDYPTVVLEPVPAEIPEKITVTPGMKPEDVIPKNVSGFKLIEHSDFITGVFEGEEYSANSFFQPAVGSKYQGEVDSLSVHVHKFQDEASAIEAASIIAMDGTTIQIDSISAILDYGEDFGDTAVSWRHENLVIISDVIPPFEVTTPNEQILKEAAIEGAKAAAYNLD